MTTLAQNVNPSRMTAFRAIERATGQEARFSPFKQTGCNSTFVFATDANGNARQFLRSVYEFKPMAGK